MRATSTEIAHALDRVHAKVAPNTYIIQSANMSRGDRELLVTTGWLQEIIRGWYLLVRPDISSGDSAAWYSNFWDFIRLYLNNRFESEYCLSVESSLDLWLDKPTTPQQVVVITKQGTGLLPLLFKTSLMVYADPKNFPTETREKQGLRVMTLPYALCKASPRYFKNNPREAELALRSVQDPHELSKLIAQYNLKASAARLIGAYEFLHDEKMATALKKDLSLIGVSANTINPFIEEAPLLSHIQFISPYAARITAMWNEARGSVLSHFPDLPKTPPSIDDYLKSIDHVYQNDAYNSLSIEGYQVTPELIQRVKNNIWDPLYNPYDNDSKNAMAAKGYYDAFQIVKNSITDILNGQNAAVVVKRDLQKWFQYLFGPSVKAGLLSSDNLLGYRNDRVFIRNSRHCPPPKEAVKDAMDAFFECLTNEPLPGIQAVLGHYFFAFIHPYMDGNGRIARFLMNAFLASGGYPWTVIHVHNRTEYIDILEKTHIQFDLTDFANFIKKEMYNP